MSDLERVREWLMEYPGMEALQKVWVDYYPARPDNGSIAPAGLTELSRRMDILGTLTVEDRYDFGIYYVLTKAEGDDVGATANAQWVMDFQNWVQEQSARRLAPVFGNRPQAQWIRAQEGALKKTHEEGLATYLVRLSIHFEKVYEVI